MPIDHLPDRVRPIARRVRAFLMTDSTALLILAGVQIAVGIYYLPGCLGDPLHWQRPSALVMPIIVWAWVHIVVGVVGAVAAIVRKWHVDTVMLMVSTALNLAWASSLLVASVEYDEAILLIAFRAFPFPLAGSWSAIISPPSIKRRCKHILLAHDDPAPCRTRDLNAAA